MMIHVFYSIGLFIIGFISFSMMSPCLAETGNPTYSLSQLLAIAEKNYPLFKAKRHEIGAANKSIALAQTATIPSLDFTFQSDLATYNNATGMFYPQGLLPISGPPTDSNQFLLIPGMATSLMFNWTPITFGQTEAQAHLAEKEMQGKIQDIQNDIFNHQINVANTYLNLLMAEELLKLNRNNQTRFEFNLKQIQTLVTKGLRPEVEENLLKAEFSKAKVELLNSQKEVDIQQINLAELLADQEFFQIADPGLFRNIPTALSETTVSSHPQLALIQANIETTKAKLAAIKMSLFPKLTFWGTLYGRGSGVDARGNLNVLSGLFPTHLNYGIGVYVSWPLLKMWEVNLQADQQELFIQAGQEKLNYTQLQLDKQGHLTEITLLHGLEVEKETQTQYKLAYVAYQAIQARYNAGLVSFFDLVQTQYLLLKAETDLKKAHLEIWRTLLYQAAVQGDLKPFLRQIDLLQEGNQP